MSSVPVAIADTNGLYRILAKKDPRHAEHTAALARIGHLVVSPLVLAELDYFLCERSGSRAAGIALDFIAKQADLRRFEIPDVGPHFRTAVSVAEGYRDLDGGKGVGLTDAMNAALAAAYRTDAVFTTDKHFRVIRPLTRHDAFRLLPEDL
ncbi:PIN domain-containing protein [Streptomyces sp. NPDC006872]|uniref:PIN domain-containing protein n=1 Tax=Streptomyces sp. NPDC006872 TaxID=3155720 RepID=UPI0033DFDF08